MEGSESEFDEQKEEEEIYAKLMRDVAEQEEENTDKKGKNIIVLDKEKVLLKNRCCWITEILLRSQEILAIGDQEWQK